MTETTMPASPAPLDDDPAIDDLAAELDDAEPSDAAGETVVDDDEESAYSGVCRGGPYDGRSIDSRFPGGFLLYDKQRQQMWTYTADPARPGEFTLLPSGETPPNLSTAADGVEYDVIAYDDGPAVT